MPATGAAHPGSQVLQAYGLGQLDGSRLQEVEAHVGGCIDCLALLDEYPSDPFVSALRSAYAIPPADVQAQPLAETSAPFLDNAGTDSDPPEVPPELEGHARYRVSRLIGRGGMGAVYEAEHTLMERTVALKIISPRLLEHAGALARFGQEVKTAARLQHPNIVTAFDAEQVGSLTVLVLEYVEGRSLAEYLDEVGPLPIEPACDYVRQAALGLQHAHDQGMVHRDIKPHNLMLTPGGLVKILDFGLARFVSEGLDESPPESPGETMLSPDTPEPDRGLTGSGACMGTLDYVAPEQACDARQADARADLYSLGCTLYQLLTGRVPFPGGASPEKLARLAAAEPTPVRELRPDVPPALAALLGKMMAKRPEDRCPSAAAVADSLVAFTAAAARQRQHRRRKVLAALVALLFLTGVALAAAVFKISTEQGEVVIETDDAAIEVVVKGDRIVRIRDPKTGREYVLDRQNLTLGELDGGGLQLTLDGTKPVLLKRNGQKIASVRLVPKAAEPPAVSEVRVFREGFQGVAWRPRVGFTPDGSRVFASNYGQEPKILVWDRGNGGLLRAQTMGGNGFDVTLSADGKMFALVNKQKRLELRTSDTGLLVREFPKGPTGKLWAVALSADAGRLAAAGDDGLVYVLRADTGELLWKQDCGVKPVRALAVSPDGSRVATGGRGAALTMWDGNTGQLLKRLGKPDCWCCQFTPDGERIIAAGSGEIDLWNTTTGNRLGHWEQKPSVECVVLGPDGERFATGSFDGTIRVWQFGREQPLHSFDAHHHSALWVAFAPGGLQLASSGKDGAVRLWDLPGEAAKPAAPAEAPFKPFFGHTDLCRGAMFGPDGMLYTCSDDGTARAWDPAGREVRRFDHGAVARAVAVAEGGRTLLTAGEFGLRAWDAATGKVLGAFPAVPRGEILNGLAVDPEGKLAATVAINGTVRVWDIAGRKSVRDWKTGSGRAVWVVAWSPDGQAIAISGDDGTVTLWNPATGKPASRHNVVAPVSALSFSPDGKRLFVGCFSLGVRAIERATGAVATLHAERAEDHVRLAVTPGGWVVVGQARRVEVWGLDGKVLGEAARTSSVVTWVAVSPDGRRIAAVGYGGTVTVATLTPAALRPLPASTPPLPELTELWQTKDQRSPRAVAVSPEGKWAYSSGYDNTARQWNLSTRQESRRFGDGMEPFDSLSLSPDGKRLLLAHHKTLARLWDVESGKELQTFKGHTSTVASVALSPDAKRALTGAHDNTVRLWDVETGKELKTLTGHAGPVRAVAFLPDKRAVSGGHDRTVRVWNLDTGETTVRFGPFDNYVLSLAVAPGGKRMVVNAGSSAALLDRGSGLVTQWFKGHTDKLHAVAISPDGRLLATGGYDKTVRVWELDTGQCLAVGRGHTDYVVSVVFVGNSQVLSAGDHTIRLWELPGAVGPPRP